MEAVLKDDYNGDDLGRFHPTSWVDAVGWEVRPEHTPLR